MPRLDFIRKQRWPASVEHRMGLVTPPRAIVTKDFDGVRAGEEIYRMKLGGMPVFFEEEPDTPEEV